MALNAYLQQTQRLLNDVTAQFYEVADLTSYVNTARNQLAAESRSVRAIFFIQVGPTNAGYSGINYLTGGPEFNFPPPSPFWAISFSAIQNIRNIMYLVPPYGSAPNFQTQQAMRVAGRNWEWYSLYDLPNLYGTAPGPPQEWSIQAAGDSGKFFLFPLLDQNYVLSLDCDFLPLPLASDSDPEALTYPWTDAVPYFAAYMALMNANRMKDADDMFQRYEVFAKRGRELSTPTVLPMNFPTSPPATGIGSSGGGGGGGQQGGGQQGGS